MPYWLKRCLKKYFLNHRFFIAVFVGSQQFLPNFKPYSNKPLCTKAFCQKSWGVNGRPFLSYSALKVLSQHFPEIACSKYNHCSMAPPPQIMSGPMSELWRAIAHLFF
jgi:hypothetical protein